MNFYEISDVHQERLQKWHIKKSELLKTMILPFFNVIWVSFWRITYHCYSPPQRPHGYRTCTTTKKATSRFVPEVIECQWFVSVSCPPLFVRFSLIFIYSLRRLSSCWKRWQHQTCLIAPWIRTNHLTICSKSSWSETPGSAKHASSRDSRRVISWKNMAVRLGWILQWRRWISMENAWRYNQLDVVNIIGYNRIVVYIQPTYMNFPFRYSFVENDIKREPDKALLPYHNKD